MKINNLLEGITAASSPENATSPAPKFGRSDKFLEEKEEQVEECTTSGSVASVASPVGGMQRRGKGSIFAGIKTSSKYPNSKVVKEGAYEDGVRDGIQGQANPRASSIYGPESSEYSRGYEDGLVKGKEQSQANVSAYQASLAPYKEIPTDELKQMLRDIRKRTDARQSIYDKYRGSSRFSDSLPPNSEELKQEHKKDHAAWQAIHQELFQRGVSNDQRVAESSLNEFAPSGGNEGDDGFSEETLKMLATQWYNGDEDPRVERTLMAAGWEIGQDEGYDDEPGVFVVQRGDVNGNSYMSWPAHELQQGVGEAVTLDRSKNPKYPNDVDTVKHKIAVAKEILSDPKSDYDSRRIAASILAQEEQLLRQYKDTEAKYKGVAEEQLDEKSKSKAQFRTMAAVAHNPEFAKKVGISQKVGKEFHKADKGSDYSKLPSKVDEVSQDLAVKTLATRRAYGMDGWGNDEHHEKADRTEKRVLKKFGQSAVDAANKETDKQVYGDYREVKEGEGNFAKAIDNLHGWYQVKSNKPELEIYEFDDREGGFYADGTVYHNVKTGRVKIEFEDKMGEYGGMDVNETFNSIGDAMNVLRQITIPIRQNTSKAPNFDRLARRDKVTPDSLRKTDRTGRKGTISGSHANNLKQGISFAKGTHGPKGVLPEAEISEDMLAHELFKDLQIFKKGADKDIGSKAKDKDISKKAKDKDIVTKEDKDPCWKGYKQIGMKDKGGKKVPNCVPKK